MVTSESSTWLIPDNLLSDLMAEPELFRARSFKAGESLYLQGDQSTKFYVMISGLVQVSMVREDGTEIILELMGSDTLLGEGAALDGLPRFSSATALKDSEVLEFDTKNLEHAQERVPEFIRALLRITSLKQRVLAVRLEQFSSRSPEDRIMELFLRLSNIFAERRKDGMLIVPKLTHDQIAMMTGNTRVTVTRAIGRLKREGVISSSNGRILVLSRNPSFPNTA